jgi:hypothetical protein
MAAVKEAKDSFVCAELGAGWGPWLVSSTFAPLLVVVGGPA